ncbi:MAG: hypothetical protein RSD07_11495, partial [Angelakisella sp.]
VVCYWFFNRFYEKKIWMFSAVLLLSLPTLFLTPSSDTVKIIGVGIGAIAGLVWEVKSINFTVDGTFWHRVLRMLLGGAIILVLRMGLKVIFPETMFFDGLRYGFMGVAATGFIPWIFTRYKL